MSFADRLAEDVREHRIGPKCRTCMALAALDAEDLAAYHDATERNVPAASIARALDLRPGTFREHRTAGHVDPR